MKRATISKRVFPLSKRILASVEQILESNYSTVTALVRALNTRFNVVSGVTFKQQKSDTTGILDVSGFCYFEGRSAPIEVILQYYDVTMIGIEQCKRDLAIHITATIVHELTHRRQYQAFRSDPNVPEDDVGYYSHHYEVEAHAIDIAFELIARGRTHLLHDINAVTSDNCWKLSQYKEVFATNHVVMRRLLSKIFKIVQGNTQLATMVV